MYHINNLFKFPAMYFFHSSTKLSKRISYMFLFHHCCSQRSCYSVSRHSKLPVLTLYTKQHCPLCDEALDHLKPMLHQVILDKVDITAPENRAWWKAYRYEIPVFHLNGKFLMKHKANLDILKNALRDYNNDCSS